MFKDFPAVSKNTVAVLTPGLQYCLLYKIQLHEPCQSSRSHGLSHTHIIRVLVILVVNASYPPMKESLSQSKLVLDGLLAWPTCVWQVYLDGQLDSQPD